jgi:NAD(P)-dependent dehydrogenase (short-subunit alcohol dehydrogenase family)
MASAGWNVVAGVRHTEHGESLAAQGSPGRIAPLLLDVTDPAHIEVLDEKLPARVDALVNNAGIVIDGPVETVPLDDLRRQFEVNVVGQVAVTQSLLPRLRESRGRIVFISSVSGRLSSPLLGVYSASKFALEGLADALRIELRPWGIKVTLVEPAATDTDLWRTAVDQIDSTEASLSDKHRRLYEKHVVGARRLARAIQKQAVPVDNVATAVERALTSPRPRARYVVGALPKVQLAIGAATPTPAMDAALARASGIPRKI